MFNMEYTKLSHCVYHCEYHLVLVTKYRREIFNEGVFAYFKAKLDEICKYYPLIKASIVNHDRNHLHMSVSIPSTMSVGNAVKIIKANTAKSLKKKFLFLKKAYWGTESVWSEGYFISTEGVDKKTIKMYIERQGQEDIGQAKLVLG